MIEYLQQLDHDLFLFLNNLGSPTWDWFWLTVTNKWAAIPLYLLLVYLLYKKIGLKFTLITLVLVAAMITCTDQGANLFKDGFKRLRPCGTIDPAKARFVDDCGVYGFFSAHAASTMALAIFIGNILKRYYKYALVSLLVWSLFVGYSRIYLGVHYPGDVIVGFLMGALIGGIFLKLHRLIAKKYFSLST